MEIHTAVLPQHFPTYRMALKEKLQLPDSILVLPYGCNGVWRKGSTWPSECNPADQG